MSFVGKLKENSLQKFKEWRNKLIDKDGSTPSGRPPGRRTPPAAEDPGNKDLDIVIATLRKKLTKLMGQSNPKNLSETMSKMNILDGTIRSLCKTQHEDGIRNPIVLEELMQGYSDILVSTIDEILREVAKLKICNNPSADVQRKGVQGVLELLKSEVTKMLETRSLKRKDVEVACSRDSSSEESLKSIAVASTGSFASTDDVGHFGPRQTYVFAQYNLENQSNFYFPFFKKTFPKNKNISKELDVSKDIRNDGSSVYVSLPKATSNVHKLPVRRESVSSLLEPELSQESYFSCQLANQEDSTAYRTMALGSERLSTSRSELSSPSFAVSSRSSLPAVRRQPKQPTPQPSNLIEESAFSRLYLSKASTSSVSMKQS